MSASSIIDKINQGIDFLEQFAPAAAAFGLPVGPVLAIAGSISDIIGNIAERAEEAGVVLTSQDQAEIKSLTERLAAQNDILRKAIDAS